MYLKNSDLIMSQLRPDDVVLDIGGWAHPFNRANYIMDFEPYETRGYYNRQLLKDNHPPLPPLGGDKEFFSKETWIQRDICDKTPYPFRDKEIDFVICSHTLEDVRDPLWVCAEMIRIAKKGYLEIPSRQQESSRGSEPNIVGLSHHRWLIDINVNESAIVFMMKYHIINSHWRFSLPASYGYSLAEEQRIQWLFWENEFKYSEKILHGQDQITELENFVAKIHPYPPLYFTLDRQTTKISYLGSRVIGKLRRTFSIP